MDNDSKFPDWLESAAKQILDHCNTECDEKRKYMIPIWKRAEYYWNDVQDLFWNRAINDWSTFDEDAGEDAYDAIKDSNKIFNIYRAYGESIIAAATMGNLSIRFFPAKSNNPEDIDKARSFSDKADYIQKNNEIKEVRRRAYTICWNQGLVGSYVYFKRDKAKYGSFDKDVIGKKISVTVNRSCSNCDYQGQPSVHNDPTELAASAMPMPCPTCPPDMETGVPPMMDSTQSREETPYKAGTESVDRGCTVIELFDPLHLKVPFYATKASEVNYIIVETEMHYATARALYPDHADKINAGNTGVEAEDRIQPDQFGGLSSRNLVTVSRIWVKPELYNVISDDKDEIAAQLLKDYPDGKFSTFINNSILVDCQNVDMDACWTLTDSSTDTHIYHRPLGNAVIPIQDLENDLLFIAVDTIRHAIGETFYDSRVIDPNRYNKAKAQPGSMFPVENKRGSAQISDYFYSTKNASLSREVDTMFARLETMGQLVSSAFPSIYGGAMQGGSKTLGVYQESRNQALQRIAIPSDRIDNFLINTVRKATEVFDKNMEDEESYPVENGTGFRDVLMRKSAPGAKISRAEAVKSEQFPTTWEQKRAFVMELVDKNNEAINSTIFSSDNIGLMNKIVGIPELIVPGEQDHNKQLHEIQELLNSQPTPVMGQELVQGQQPQYQSTIAVDGDVDNHSIHIGTVLFWANSPEGIRAKKENPGGYANVIQHMKEHEMLLQEMQAAQPAPDQGASNGKPDNTAQQ